MTVAPPINPDYTRERDELASAIGEERSLVRVRSSVDWAAMLKQGVLVKVNIRRWRAVSAINLADLGLENLTDKEKAELVEVMDLGQRYMLPRDLMKRARKIERDGRDLLHPGAGKTYALPTHWGSLVPVKRYRQWRAENDALRAQYFAIAAELEARWDELVVETRAKYAAVARATYRRVRAMGYANDVTEAEFVERFVNRSLARMETKSRAVESFVWQHTVEIVPLATGLAAQVAQIASQGTGPDPLADDLERTQAARLAGGLPRFVADIRSAIRSRIYDAVVDALKAMNDPKNAGKLPRNSTAQLRRLLIACERLNFWPDDQLEARLAELSEIVEQDAAQRSPAELRGVLQMLGAESRAVLLELERPPARSAQSLGIPDSYDALGEMLGFEQRGAPAEMALGAGDAEADPFDYTPRSVNEIAL